MTFDTIAFTQDELDNALNLCCTSIGLCDNDFILPQIAYVCRRQKRAVAGF